MFWEFVIGCFAMTSALQIFDEHAPTFCDSMSCANNATCRTTVTKNDMEGSHVTHSECICHGHWIGQKCDHYMSLTLLGYHTNHAIFQTYMTYSDNQKGKLVRDVQKLPQTDPTFNVQYWSEDSGDMCSIMTAVQSKQFQISGLQPGATYSVCVSSNQVDLCFIRSRSDLEDFANCIVFTTVQENITVSESESDDFNTSSVAAPVALSIFFCVLIIIVIVTVVKCRKERYYEEIQMSFRRWMYSIRQTNWPCVTRNSPCTTVEARHNGWPFPRSVNHRYRGSCKAVPLHPTGNTLATIDEHKLEDAETSSSPLMNADEALGGIDNTDLL